MDELRRGIWAALRADRPVGGDARAWAATPTPTPLTVTPDRVPVQIVNATGVAGLARQARDALAVQGFAGVTTSEGVARPDGALVEYTGGHAEDARTVAAAFPGARTRKAPGPEESIPTRTAMTDICS